MAGEHPDHDDGEPPQLDLDALDEPPDLTDEHREPVDWTNPPPAVQRAMQELGRQVIEWSEVADLGRRIARQIATTNLSVPAFGYSRQLTASVWDPRLLTNVREVLAGITRRQAEYLRANGPENWADLADGVSTTGLFQLAASGIPIAWVPPAAVLAKLIAATDEHRGDVLVAHAGVILESCVTAVEPLRGGDWTNLVVLLDHVAQAGRAGNWPAVQALATNLAEAATRLLSEVEKNAGPFKKWKTRRTEISEQRDGRGKFTLTQLMDERWAIAFWPAVLAFEYVDFDGPEPGGYNRHSTAHKPSLTQYTTVNAITAAMLAASMLRAIHDRMIGLSEASGR